MENQTTIPSQPKKWYQQTGGVVVLLILFFPVGLYLMWKNAVFSKTVRWIITGFFVIAIIANMGREKKSDSTSSTHSPSNQSAVTNVQQSEPDSKPIVTSDESPAEARSSSSDNSSDDKPSYNKIGDQIEVGNFSYVVNSAKFAKTIGNEFIEETADGMFLLVNVTFRNNDNEEHTLDNSFFKLTDANGTEFESSTSGSTALELSGKKTLFLKQCNPHISKSGLLVFEVPEKGIYYLHLSGGFWSGKTAVVKLTGK